MHAMTSLLSNHSEYVLPLGDDLRVFLNQDCISESLLRRLLRKRGVFVPSVEKADLIPFLLLSYLTPSEFDELLSHVRKREDREMERSTSHSVICEAQNLGDLLPQHIDIHSIATDKFGNSEILGTPVLTHEKEGRNDSYIIRFKTERTNIAADWIRSRRVFEGSIRFTLDAESKRLIVTTIHTSAETEMVNRLVSRHIAKDLRDRQIIGKEPITRVTFGSFTNEERIRFFMKFTGVNEPIGISFEKMTDLALKLDETAGVPSSSLNWMTAKVTAVKLKGQALHDTFFVTEMECRPYVIFWKTVCAFKFVTADYSGSFTAVFEFADYASSGDSDSEFQISIESLTIEGRRPHHPDHVELTRRFTSRLTMEKEKAFKSIVESRNS